MRAAPWMDYDDRIREDEKIDRAAIRFGGVIYSVERPFRHNDVVRKIIYLTGVEVVIPETQGFITSTGRFVERKEALDIATKAGQMRNTPHAHGLFSEDVW